jgi:hypothetical protein
MFKANLSLRRHRAVVGLGAAVASLAFTGVASAAVTVVTPDVSTTYASGGSCPATATSSNLTNAIQNATAANNTLVLEPGIYCPVTPSGQSTITLSHNINIVADHSFQATGGLANIDVSGIDATGANEFTVAPGTDVTLEGFDIENGGMSGGSVFTNDGTLTAWGMEFEANNTPDIINATAASVVTLDDSSVDGSLDSALTNYGTMTVDEADITNGSGRAFIIEPGSTTDVYNTLIADNNTAEGNCQTGTITAGAGDIADDNTCGPHVTVNTDVDNYLGASANGFTGNEYTNGGPATSVVLTTNPDTSLKGVSQYCFMTDQRFFVNPIIGGKVACDIGATTDEADPSTGAPDANSATQETTAPSCVATGGVSGVSQTVALSDSGSGIGPEIGLATDNLANTVATAYPPPAASPVPGYAVDNLQISNGSVSFTSPTAPQPSLTLTAGNKTTPGVNNSQWSFTGLNWAGIAHNCY